VSPRERLNVLQKRWRDVVEEFGNLADSGPDAEDRERMLSALRELRLLLTRIELRMTKP
jgi:hypothetical protein